MAVSDSLSRPTKALSLSARWRALAGYERPAALLLAALVFVTVQSGSPHIIGIDGQYHIKVAALIREQGPRLEFPWLRYTILNQERYTDHHLLFHLLQAPFTVLDLGLAAKLSSALFATLSFWGCYLIMARCGVRWPLAWLALLLAVSHTFLWRHAMARPQSLALLLMVATLWLIAEGRLKWLIPLGFASAWLFDGFILPLTIPGAWLVARLALERRLDWRPLAYLLLGTGLGLLIHPYFPRNVVFAFHHLFPKIAFGATEEQVRVGSEWYPYTRWGFYSRVGPAVAVMVLGLVPILARLWHGKRPNVASLTLTLLAIGFLALQVRSQRIIEYFPAFAVLLAAWSWSFNPLQLPLRPRDLLARWRVPLLGLGLLLLAGGLTHTVWQARRDVLNNAGVKARQDSYRTAALWLAANSPPGALVFNRGWDDFPQLFFWNTHNVYVVGLDLTYLSLYDPELYRLWRSISNGSTANPSGALRERFGAEYVFTESAHGPFLAQAAADPGLEEVYRSPAAVVFRVRTGS